MKSHKLKINWPNGTCTTSNIENCWLDEARKAGIVIPTGCLNGSCGACEIDIDGKTIRACITRTSIKKSDEITVEFTSDPYW